MADARLGAVTVEVLLNLDSQARLGAMVVEVLTSENALPSSNTGTSITLLGVS